MLVKTQRESHEKDYSKQQSSSEEVRVEVQDLEDELEELQSKFDHQLSLLRERLQHEEHRRKKAQEELQTINSLNDHSMTAMKKTHEELLEELRRHYEEQITTLRDEHVAELQEEKKATKMALDAVQRAHDAELKNIAEKVRTMSSCGTGTISSGIMSSSQACTSVDIRNDIQSTRQSKMLEQMSTELAQLSALYSAKCLENSQLDEKMSLLLADKENQSLLK
ncbi:unnamed protein product [Thelazia callipaeda]|uniref:AKAP9 n=1 Tax=Thelazia callipaeda TaxID=103827 RepID=A0A0N5DC57_THECL|nr:unnamed protein product [Thelazia callipaeda]